ncbi:MAG: hypothetical protein VX737_00920 [Pseudomonadota bacterium]|nr:hypothetical protein [Pseudomonadota bacterium]
MKSDTFSQIASAFVVALVIYLVNGNYDRLISGVYLTSKDTQKVNEIMQSPEKLNKMMLTRIQKNPKDQMAWKILSMSYHQMGEEEKALAAYRKARSLDEQ